jgi:superoxide dismutase, Cu-Zn family
MKRLLTAAALCAVAAPAAAQDARAVLMHRDGHEVGTVALTQLETGVLIEAGLIGMEPGEYGFHIHETGECAPDFEAAGGHFAPDGNAHGFDNPDGPHAGDLPNVEIAENGQATVELFTDRISLREGEAAALLDGDGAAIMIHADADTYQEEASAGSRIACGVIEAI